MIFPKILKFRIENLNIQECIYCKVKSLNVNKVNSYKATFILRATSTLRLEQSCRSNTTIENGVKNIPQILQLNRTDDCYTQLFKIAVQILTKQDVENEMLQNFQLLLKLKEKELEIKSCGQSAAGSVLQHLITKQYLCDSIILNIDETFFRPSYHLLYLYLKKDENLFNELNTFRLNKLTNNLPHECESEIVEVMDKFDAKGNFQRMLDYNGYQVNKIK
ncbi:Hypothetical_protein [Hexamita inflata]|uniref:Hypothetical_protein n=1 Tax=Hexamita inflata TaxID=28002 RepID=A0AA86P4P3_9EUKA|nr:Hypothetical protein HINF_LOCUS19549 [Hexamita inflata]